MTRNLDCNREIESKDMQDNPSNRDLKEVRKKRKHTYAHLLNILVYITYTHARNNNAYPYVFVTFRNAFVTFELGYLVRIVEKLIRLRSNWLSKVFNNVLHKSYSAILHNNSID
uniref:Uncharacterized protein n=1 Tax=Glossina austeni TaxID=7395 RepID=A0A1A9VBP1_GLOAU